MFAGTRLALAGGVLWACRPGSPARLQALKGDQARRSEALGDRREGIMIELRWDKHASLWSMRWNPLVKKVPGSGLCRPSARLSRYVLHEDQNHMTTAAVATLVSLMSWAQPCTQSTRTAERGHKWQLWTRVWDFREVRIIIIPSPPGVVAKI